MKSIGFTKVPDASGDGICLVGIEGKNGAESSVYVPFKVLVKRTLYMAKRNIGKGDVIHLVDLIDKGELPERRGAPLSGRRRDIVGKGAKKEIRPGRSSRRRFWSPRGGAKGRDGQHNGREQQAVVQAKGTALGKRQAGRPYKDKEAQAGKEVVGKVTGNDFGGGGVLKGNDKVRICSSACFSSGLHLHRAFEDSRMSPRPSRRLTGPSRRRPLPEAKTGASAQGRIAALFSDQKARNVGDILR